jgi:hypothetical protein
LNIYQEKLHDIENYEKSIKFDFEPKEISGSSKQIELLQADLRLRDLIVREQTSVLNDVFSKGKMPVTPRKLPQGPKSSYYGVEDTAKPMSSRNKSSGRSQQNLKLNNKAKGMQRMSMDLPIIKNGLKSMKNLEPSPLGRRQSGDRFTTGPDLSPMTAKSEFFGKFTNI